LLISHSFYFYCGNDRTVGTLCNAIELGAAASIDLLHTEVCLLGMTGKSVGGKKNRWMEIKIRNQNKNKNNKEQGRTLVSEKVERVPVHNKLPSRIYHRYIRLGIENVCIT